MSWIEVVPVQPLWWVGVDGSVEVVLLEQEGSLLLENEISVGVESDPQVAGWNIVTVSQTPGWG